MQSATVKTRPIIFSGDMVRAIQRGEKTQTRRCVKPHNSTVDGGSAAAWWPKLNFEQATARQTATIMQALHGAAAPRDVHLRVPHIDPEEGSFHRVRPCWDIGDRLRIKTAYTTRYDEQQDETCWSVPGIFFTTHGRALTKNGKPIRDGLHAAMFMPNWLSEEFRYPQLETVDVRVERVQEISDSDIRHEGVSCPTHDFPGGMCVGPRCWELRRAFADLWDSINGKRYGCAWDLNPFCWVLEFKRVEEK